MIQADLFRPRSDDGAVFSPCRTWRYRLTRSIPDGVGGTDLWVMLNPSVANEVKPDPTITKVLGFSRRWGSSRVVVVNLFGLVSTKPRGLRTAPDPIGPENDDHIRAALLDTSLRRIVIAWGAPGARYDARVDAVLDLLSPRGPTPTGIRDWEAGARARQLHHLGLRTAEGQPGHPLMLAYATDLVPWFPEDDPEPPTPEPEPDTLAEPLFPGAT